MINGIAKTVITSLFAWSQSRFQNFKFIETGTTRKKGTETTRKKGTGIEPGGTVPIPIPSEAGSKSRLFSRHDGIGTGISVKNGIGTTESRVNTLMVLSLDELYSQKTVMASKIPKKYFSGTGIGMGFCRVRDGRDRDKKNPVSYISSSDR
jgi:hypothetical protein